MELVQTIFYSWQSDLPKKTNQNCIRHVLRSILNKIETQSEGLSIQLDEATRNTSGSPNIPATIFDKITNADIFICDITTITHKDCTFCKRKVANPNVLIELGFAISQLGWERIILLFNENFGTFPDDLPFDIDRHRTMKYCVKDENDNEGKDKFSIAINNALKAIISKSPLKPSEKKEETPEQKKRNRDIIQIKWLLSQINIPSFDHFIEELPDRIFTRVIFFREGLISVLNGNSFYLYDKNLLTKIENFRRLLDYSLSFDKHFSIIPYGAGRYANFYMPMDIIPTEEANRDYKKLTQIKNQLAEALKELLDYVRDNYIEIDIDETSKIAFENYIDNHSDE